MVHGFAWFYESKQIFHLIALFSLNCRFVESISVWYLVDINLEFYIYRLVNKSAGWREFFFMRKNRELNIIDLMVECK